MIDLSGKLEGQSIESIAKYFSMDKSKVELAISQGAKTYQDIYDFKNKRKSTMVELVEELEKIKIIMDYEEVDFLISEAKHGEFHDYKNRKYTCGKMAFCELCNLAIKEKPELLQYLTPLVDDIKSGVYDEEVDDIDKKTMLNDIMDDKTMNTNQKKGLINMLGLKNTKSPYGKRYF